MKHLFTCLFLLLSVAVFAQSPEQFNYQGVARDNGGNVLATQAIGLRLSILSGSASGTVEYSETHAVTTNAFGLFNVAIGGGAIVSGSFAGVSWGSDAHFVKVEMNPTGVTPPYQNMGTSQLLSVPYALYAENSGTSGPVGPTGATGADGTQWTTGTGLAPWPADEGDLYFNTSTGEVSQVIAESWTSIGNIMGSNGATGPTGATGPLVAGNTNETLRHNGSSWQASGVLTNNGTNVGIGASTPTEKLDVNGNIAVTGSGRSIFAPNGTFNVSSASGIDMIIDNDNNSTNSSLKIKRNADGLEIIFEAKENGDVEVEGGIEVGGEYAYASSKTHYQSFPSSAFSATKPGSYTFGQSSIASINDRYGVFVSGGTSLGYADAALNLPDGATVTEIKAWIWDNDATKPVRVQLYAVTLGTDDGSPVSSSAESDVATAMASIQEVTVPVNLVIDNSTQAYQLIFTGGQANEETRLYNVRITYTVDQAD